MAVRTGVSIHTRHYWRVKLARASGFGDDIAVSIHTRHYWRVKREWRSPALA